MGRELSIEFCLDRGSDKDRDRLHPSSSQNTQLGYFCSFISLPHGGVRFICYDGALSIHTHSHTQVKRDVVMYQIKLVLKLYYLILFPTRVSPTTKTTKSKRRTLRNKNIVIPKRTGKYRKTPSFFPPQFPRRSFHQVV